VAADFLVVAALGTEKQSYQMKKKSFEFPNPRGFDGKISKIQRSQNTMILPSSTALITAYSTPQQLTKARKEQLESVDGMQACWTFAFHA
jgi:hypothetical protein